MTDDLDCWLDFRANESRADRPLTCCECGEAAEGNVSCDDGPVCDGCHERAEGMCDHWSWELAVSADEGMGPSLGHDYGANPHEPCGTCATCREAEAADDGPPGPPEC